MELAGVYENIRDTSTALSLYRRAEQLDLKCSNKIKELTMINGFNLILSGSSKPLMLDEEYKYLEEPYQRFRSHVLATVK